MKPSDLFSVQGRIGRKDYAIWGFSLMLLKYVVDAAVVYFTTASYWTPLDYLSPLLSTRQRLGTTTAACLAVWTLPFIWIGIAMSARRCRDAGMSLVTLGCYFLPVINYIFMLVMCVVPSRRAEDGAPPLAHPADKDVGLLSAALAGALLAVPLVGFFTKVMPSYTGSMFVGAPFTMGAFAGWVYSRRGQVLLRQLATLTTVMAVIVGGMLLLFALEGAVCLVMTLPLAWPVLFIGALLGRELRQRSKARAKNLAPAFLVPLMLLHLVPSPDDSELHAVSSTVTIHASPDEVFERVVSFSELPPPKEWLFRLTGVAYPIRADIVGSGVGAVRYCQFTTGPFVEPITKWVPGKHLAFDVARHPASMEESSPYHALQPAHLESAFQSRRGEFRMNPCGVGATCLTGTTWYTLQMGPSLYWRWWADAIVKTIHGRVLDHVKTLAENG